MITRLIDIIISLIGLLILLLLLPWIAFLIKIGSKGPVFYRSKRVGQGGRIFDMYKFRTMYDTPVPLGPGVSPQGDPRVTPVGRVLRRLKLNEFPQFINILKGDMTLIGPRPETPDLAAVYPEAAQKIFTVKPGLAGPNQIWGRNEEELYPPGVDPVKYYVEDLLPRKLPLDLDYIENKSLFKDFKYLFMAVKVTLTEAIGCRHLLENWSQLFMLGCDAFLCFLSFTLALYIRYGNAHQPLRYIGPFIKVLPLAVLTRMPVFIYFGFYHTLIRHLSFYDIKQVIKGVAFGSLILVVVTFLAGFMHGYSRAVYLIDWLCLTSLLIGFRAALMSLHRRYVNKTNSAGNERNVIICGAGDAGDLCLRYLQKEREALYNIVGFIDDDPQIQGKKIGGVKILGSQHHLDLLARLYNIQEVFVAISSASASEVDRILEVCQNLGLRATLFNPMGLAYSDSRKETPLLTSVADQLSS
jgi:lipopolysaccharide/colanic/teichoic acid biosynthesis glycosyltransferase